MANKSVIRGGFWGGYSLRKFSSYYQFLWAGEEMIVDKFDHSWGIFYDSAHTLYDDLYEALDAWDLKTKGSEGTPEQQSLEGCRGYRAVKPKELWRLGRLQRVYRSSTAKSTALSSCNLCDLQNLQVFLDFRSLKVKKGVNACKA